MINVVFDDAYGEWQVWSDTEVQEKDGRCIGCDRTETKALIEAIEELKSDIAECEAKLDPLLKAIHEAGKE